MIAGQDAETARVDRHRGMEAELGAEIGDGPRAVETGILLKEPSRGRRPFDREPFHDFVVVRTEIGVARQRFQTLRRCLLEHDDRVVV